MKDQSTLIERQATSMESQTPILKDSVEAAKVSAMALIRTERAWLSLESMEPEGIDLRQWRKSASEGWINLPLVHVTLNFRNFGKSPAWIMEARCQFLRTATKVEYGAPNPYDHNKSIAPGQPYQMVAYLERTETNSMDWGQFSEKELDDLFDHTLRPYVFAYVKYRDVLFPMEPPRELRLSLRLHYYNIAHSWLIDDLEPGANDST